MHLTLALTFNSRDIGISEGLPGTQLYLLSAVNRVILLFSQTPGSSIDFIPDFQRFLQPRLPFLSENLAAYIPSIFGDLLSSSGPCSA